MGAAPILAIVATVLQWLVFLLVIIATPIDVLKGKKKYGLNKTCFSMWGIKRCGNHKANPNEAKNKGFPCTGVRDLMNTAAAFSIFSIVVTIVAAILCILVVLRRLGSGTIPAIVGIIALITILIAWACIAGAFDKNCGNKAVEIKLSKIYDLSGGFGLLVAGWVLQLITVILLFLS